MAVNNHYLEQSSCLILRNKKKQFYQSIFYININCGVEDKVLPLFLVTRGLFHLQNTFY